jgi:hypothetical protein
MEFVDLVCPNPDCRKEFRIECPVEIEDGEEVVKVGMFDDICPRCGTQAEFKDEQENA